MPFDKKLPLFLIDLAKEFGNDGSKYPLEQLNSYIYSARQIAPWAQQDRSPRAQELTMIGPPGDKDAEVHALLEENGIVWREAYPPELEDTLPPASWTIPETELASRADFRHLRVFSIDPWNAKDLDDALSIEPLPNGHFRVGVHIADVSFFVHPKSLVDLEARRRTTTIYLVPVVFPMLPRVLSENLCSLNPGVDRCAFSVRFELDAQARLVGEPWFGPSVIRSCSQLDYGQAQLLHDGDIDAVMNPVGPTARKFVIDDSNPKLPHTTVEHLQKDIRHLMALSRLLKQKRIDDGAVILDDLKLSFMLDESRQPISMQSYPIRETNSMIEEFMLLANRLVATKLFGSLPDAAVLRYHPAPNERKMKELINFCLRTEVPFDPSTSLTLQRSLVLIHDTYAEKTPLVYKVIMKLLQKPMNQAKYACTGPEERSTDFYLHWALAFPLYTHFTSPIRRYPDIMVHRLLRDALAKRDESTMSNHLMSEICDDCNEKRSMADNAERRCDHLYMFLMMNRSPELQRQRAIVMEVFKAGFRVFVPGLDLEERVLIDRIRGKTSAAFATNGPRGPAHTLTFVEDVPATPSQPAAQRVVTWTVELLTEIDVEVLPDLTKRPVAVVVNAVPPVVVSESAAAAASSASESAAGEKKNNRRRGKSRDKPREGKGRSKGRGQKLAEDEDDNDE
jgi:VacB/RNase II family 3'-5' exoribonuclease